MSSAVTQEDAALPTSNGSNLILWEYCYLNDGVR